MSVDHKPGAVARILVEAPLVTITGPVAFDAPDTAAFLEEFPEDERFDQLRRVMELGTQANGAIRTSTTLRLVEAQVSAMTNDLTTKLSELLITDRGQAQRAVKELLDDHRGKVAVTLTKYLDPDSQASLPMAMAKVFDQASAALIKRVEVLLSEGDDSALGRLAERFSTELGKSTALVIDQLAAKHALATRSALAGRPYEDALEERLVSLARPLGDQVVRCGDTLGTARSKAGDMVIRIAPEAVAGRTDVRIVVEAKHRGEAAQSFSPTEIQQSLGSARRNRAATAGLFITEAAGVLPLGIGFHEYGSSDIAVAFEPAGEDTALAIAYRLLRFALVQNARESAGGEVDRETHERVVSDIRPAMGKLDTVRAQHQAAINSITKATGAVNDVSHAVMRDLRQLDELMGP